MEDQKSSERFETIFLQYLDAAYNLAHWLTRNDQDAEDVVQESYLRAFKFFQQFRGADGRAWLLTIVRNTCYSWLQKNRAHQPYTDIADVDEVLSTSLTPETELLKNIDQQQLIRALQRLPAEFREVLVLRELEGLSYKEIASVANISIGTVMSRLARAREKLQHNLAISDEEKADVPA